MANERERDLVAETAPKKLQFTHDEESGVTTLVRLFDDIYDSYVEDVLTYLKTLSTVADPNADGLTYAGTWQVVSTEDGRILQNPQVQGIVQTLRLGTHTAEDVDSENNERYNVDRTFHFLTNEIPTLPSDTDGITYTLSSVSYDKERGGYNTSIEKRTVKYRDEAGQQTRVSPLQEGTERQQLGVTSQTVSTLSAVDGVIYSRRTNVRDDNSSDITTETVDLKEHLVEFSSGSPLSAVYEFTYRNLGNAPDVEPSEARGVYSVRTNINDGGIYDSDITYRQSVIAQAQFKQVSFPNREGARLIYENLDDPIDAPAVVNGTYEAAFRFNPDATYSGSLTYVHSNPSQFEFTQNKSFFDTTTTYVYDNEATPIAAPDAEQGVIYNTTNELQLDGTYDARLQHRKSISGADEGSGRVYWKSATNEDEAAFTLIYKSQATPVDAPEAHVDGERYTVTNQWNPDGMYESRLTKHVAVDGGDGFIASKNLKAASDMYMYFAQSDPVEAPDSADHEGGVYSVRNRRRDDGFFDADLVYETSLPTGFRFNYNVPMLTVERGRGEHVVADDVPNGWTAPAQGTMYSVSNLQLNTDQTYNYDFTTFESNSKSGGTKAAASFSTRYGTGYVYRYKNQTSVIAPSVSASGRSNSLSFSVNADRTYDVSFTSIPQRPKPVEDDYDNFTHTGTTSDYTTRWHNGKLYFGYTNIEWSVKQTRSATRAYEHVDGSKSVPGVRSGVTLLGRENYRATRINTVTMPTQWFEVSVPS